MIQWARFGRIDVGLLWRGRTREYVFGKGLRVCVMGDLWDCYGVAFVGLDSVTMFSWDCAKMCW